MKRLYIVILMLMVSNFTLAGSCGIGKVKAILEGGWNNDHYRIKINYSGGQSEHSGTEQAGYIVYESTLDEKRLNGIKSIVLTAKIADETVNSIV